MLGFGHKSVIIASPIDGSVVPVSQLSDPVFKEDVLGKGVAIIPVDGGGCVTAPADAEISLMFDTGHAVSLVTKSGVELLIHVGIDTVKLKGKHFTMHKKSEDNVKTGDLLMEFDADAIAKEGYESATPVVVCNPDNYKEITFAAEGPIKAGDPLITLR